MSNNVRQLDKTSTRRITSREVRISSNARLLGHTPNTLLEDKPVKDKKTTLVTTTTPPSLKQEAKSVVEDKNTSTIPQSLKQESSKTAESSPVGKQDVANTIKTDNTEAKAKMDKSKMHKELVDLAWEQIDSEFKEAKTKQKIKEQIDPKNTKKQAHKAIRMFVSSTFTDFFNEREILVKQVFPELKEWCALRRLDLVECDLRWGVPIDSTNDETILTCMSELDRCYQDNGAEPFFIGMISERYGWIPEVQNLSHKVIEKYKWIPNVSITFMEFLHGAIRSNNKNACFFMRKPESLAELPAKQKDRFFDTEEFSLMHLNKLKEKLRDYFPDQVFEYSCKYDGIDDSTGRPKVKLSNYENFANNAVEFFKEAISRTYPDMQPMEEIAKDEDLVQQYEIEDCYQNNYLDEKIKFYIERVQEEAAIKGFIKNEHLPDSISVHVKSVESESDSEDQQEQLGQDVQEDEQEEQEEPLLPNESRYLLVTAKEGNGKTSMMAHLVQELLDAGENVFYHFFEASIKSNDMESMAGRFIQHYSKFFNVDSKEYLKNFFAIYDSDRRQGYINELIGMIAEKSDKQFTIILDGMDSYPTRHIKYIPRALPKNVTCIITCDEKSERIIETLLEEDTWYRLHLPNMDYEATKLFVVKYLERYNKRLDDKQLKLILGKEKDALSPLWLNFACYELRVFGDHATLSKKIQDLPDTVIGLLSHIFFRLNKEFGDDIIKKILCLIEVSEMGIAENDATILLGDLKNKQELDRLKWAQIFRQLKPFLRYTYINRIQFMSFSHKSLHSVVNEIFLENNPSLAQPHHETLADFYQYRCTNPSIASRQGCYHLKELNYRQRLVEFIKTKNCQIYIQAHERSRILDEMRCMFRIHGQEEKNKILMCFSCSTSYDKLMIRMNKDSCYVCGGQITFNSSDACFCMRHYNGNPVHFTCCICGCPGSKTGALKPVTFQLCQFCGFSKKCCHIDY